MILTLQAPASQNGQTSGLSCLFEIGSLPAFEELSWVYKPNFFTRFLVSLGK